MIWVLPQSASLSLVMGMCSTGVLGMSTGWCVAWWGLGGATLCTKIVRGQRGHVCHTITEPGQCKSK